MPAMDSFQVIGNLTHRPVVVFATAYDEYAIKALLLASIKCIDNAGSDKIRNENIQNEVAN